MKNKSRFMKLWAIALPIAVQGIVFQLQSLTDKAFLGKIDDKYISALGAQQFPYGTTVTTITALMTGLIILVSRVVGAGEKDRIRKYCISTAFYGTLVTITLFCMWFFAGRDVLQIFRVDEQILPYSVTYVKYISFMMLLLGVDSALQAMLQGLGNTKPIMLCAIMKVSLNIMISYVLIYGKLGFPALNIKGAAIGTLVSNLVSGLGLVVYCFWWKRKEYGLFKDIRNSIKFCYVKEVIQIGVPTAMETFIWHASNLVLMTGLNSISYLATTVYTLTFGIEIIVYSVFNGTGKASMTLIGQDIGAADYTSADGYLKLSVVTNAILVVFCTIIFAIGANPILSLFTNNDSLIQLATPYLVFTGINMLPKSVNIVIGNGIRAYKDAKWMLYSQIFGSIFVIAFSSVLIYGMHLGIRAVYITLFLDESLRATINFLYYQKKYARNSDYKIASDAA